MDDSITINVTQDDIKNGRRNSPYLCPIALSLKRETQNSTYITVGAKYAILDFKQVGQVYRLPFDARLFISHFDNGLSVVPQSFTLDLED